MKNYVFFAVLSFVFVVRSYTQTPMKFIAKKELPKSRLELTRRSQNGSFYDVGDKPVKKNSSNIRLAIFILTSPK